MYRAEHGHGRAGFRPSIWRAPAATAFRRMAGSGSASAHHGRQADDGGGGHAGEQDGAHRLNADDGEEGLPGRRPGMREHRDAVGNVRRSDEELGHYGQKDRIGKTRKPSRAVGLGTSILDPIPRISIQASGYVESRGTGRTAGSADHMPETDRRTACIKRASIDNSLNEHSLNPLGLVRRFALAAVPEQRFGRLVCNPSSNPGLPQIRHLCGCMIVGLSSRPNQPPGLSEELLRRSETALSNSSHGGRFW